MKLFKRILLGLFILIIVGGTISFFYFKNKFLSAPPNHLTLSNVGQSFDFIWRSHTFEGKVIQNAFMFVPVSIPGVDKTFYMQFDTGAPSTVLRYKKILSVNEKYGNIFNIDTLDNQVRVKNANFKVGTVNVTASSLGFRGGSDKIDWENDPFIILGTVGNDFIEKNPIIIDYKNQNMTITEPEDERVRKEDNFLPFTFDGRRIFLSAKLNKEPVELWFDSGSSAFELIVDENTFKDLSKPNAEITSYEGSSWGRKAMVYNAESEGMFEFGNASAPLTYVTYMKIPGTEMLQFVLKAANLGSDLGGMTGNKLFLEKTLILDAPNLRYAVKE
ncbi:hypothetical protein [Marinigracilibium pacificum]|uniref:Aspartyl protease n=1 Tax=Marinigracilibium pacificum TaxID=2729599 RepID=A0A848ITG5_9BACT|nr:hypothetical protein [Marinigracilibium pacificum]NMM47637.1 hypothetical protein [Marinigracilibium pacificum]